MHKTSKPNMVWHPNGIQLQSNNQCIPRPAVRLPQPRPLQSSSTRTPPASRDSLSPIHVGVALPKQMCPLTCTMLPSSAVMHPRAAAGVRGGTTPGFSQIAIPGLLCSTGVALASDSYPYPQQDRSNTISTKLEGNLIGWPALRRGQRRRARTHSSSQSTNRKSK